MVFLTFMLTVHLFRKRANRSAPRISGGPSLFGTKFRHLGSENRHAQPVGSIRPRFHCDPAPARFVNRSMSM